MSNFNENLKTLIREVMTQDLGIKNSDVKDAVWSMIERRMNEKIDEAISKNLNPENLDKAVEKAIDKIVAAKMKNENWPFKSELQKKMEDAAKRVVFEVSVTPLEKKKK